MRLKDRIAVVTGAARGIGCAIATAMVREGATVVISDRESDAAEQTVRTLGAAHAVAITADVADPAAVERLIKAAADRFGRIDILVNNAGIGTTRLFVDTPLDEWERTLRVNLTGAFLCAQGAARLMIGQHSGRIVNIASLSGQKGGVGRAAYGASKAGLELLTKVMAVELAEHGINVNAIAPGPILTETAKGMHTQETRDAYHRLVPMRRYGEPSEIADAAVFLASDEARYITGHTINVDGGFLAAGLMFPFDPAKHQPLAAGPKE
jgi:NAD(P)-dependent dehydrogenase (short-subunit alcohol dehydrogenase family)